MNALRRMKLNFTLYHVSVWKIYVSNIQLDFIRPYMRYLLEYQ